MIYLQNILTQLCTILAAILTYLAHTYETIGTGLNPWIALPTASFLILLPHFIDAYCSLQDEERPLSHEDWEEDILDIRESAPGASKFQNLCSCELCISRSSENEHLY